MTKTLEKIVFKEDENLKPKVLWGYVTEEDERFLKITTTQGNKFTLNKLYVITRKERGDGY